VSGLYGQPHAFLCHGGFFSRKGFDPYINRFVITARGTTSLITFFSLSGKSACGTDATDVRM
jgi:hypothetical protein